MSTHNIPFSIYKTKITLNYPKPAAMGFSLGPKNEFERAVVLVQCKGNSPGVGSHMYYITRYTT